MAQWGSAIGRLMAARGGLSQLRPPHVVKSTAPRSGSLEACADFGSNPGSLRMLSYAPPGLPAKAPLVVVLHGCGQTASDYVDGAGWRDLADAHRFALLAPEQQQANNPQTCFSWFRRADTSRDTGEAGSIRAMIEHLVGDRGLDRQRIFVTGLSAGGAMAAALLALYPELFAAGAIVAGLPFRAAVSVPEAFEAMLQGRHRSAAEHGDLVRDAAGAPPRRWPRISIWQGDADRTVVPGNADELVKQWTNVHGLRPEPTTTKDDAGVRHCRWTRDGAVLVEQVRLAGLGHGTPIEATAATAPMPYMLDVGLPSSEHIARFFGLVRGDLPIRMRPTSGRPDAAIQTPGDLMAKVMRAAGLPRV